MFESIERLIEVIDKSRDTIKTSRKMLHIDFNMGQPCHHLGLMRDLQNIVNNSSMASSPFINDNNTTSSHFVVDNKTSSEKSLWYSEKYFFKIIDIILEISLKVHNIILELHGLNLYLLAR